MLIKPGNEIDVFVGASIATKEKEYALKLDGILSQEYEKELQKLKIKNGS